MRYRFGGDPIFRLRRKTRLSYGPLAVQRNSHSPGYSQSTSLS